MNDALIRTATVRMFAFCKALDERGIYQDVNVLKQWVIRQIFKQVTGVTPDVQVVGMTPFGQCAERAPLFHRVAAAERDSVNEGMF